MVPSFDKAPWLSVVLLFTMIAMLLLAFSNLFPQPGDYYYRPR
jgi:hypothetical protein